MAKSGYLPYLTRTPIASPVPALCVRVCAAAAVFPPVMSDQSSPVPGSNFI